MSDPALKIQKDNLKIVNKLKKSPEKFNKEFLNVDLNNRACFSYNCREYGSFENWEIALNVLNNLPTENRLINELIIGDTRVKPYLDIEYMRDQFPDLDLDELKTNIRNGLIIAFEELFKIDLNKKDILFTQCHRDVPKKGFKVSFHVVVSTHPTIVFQNNTYAKCVATRLQKIIVKKIVDIGVYKKTQNFRMVGHCKENELKSPIEQDSIFCDDVAEYLITNIDSDYILLESQEQGDLLYNEIRNVRKIDLASDPDLVAEIIRKVQMYHPTATFKDLDARGFYQFNYEDRFEPCFTSESEPRYHDKLGFYAYITKSGVICLGCHSANCVDPHNKKIVKILGTKGINKKIEFKKVHPNEKDFNLDQSVIRDSIINSAFGMSDLFCKMYKNPDRVKWIDEGHNGTSYFWNGSIWENDTREYLVSLTVSRLVYVLREFNDRSKNLDKGEIIVSAESESEETIKESNAIIKKLNDGSMHNSILRFVKPRISDPDFAVLKDVHPSFLSCKNGMVDLCSGELRPAIPDDNITKTLETEYDVNADSSEFEKFIREITSDLNGERPEVYNFIKWSLGYALHGSPVRKIFYIFYGPNGFNGKSLLFGIIRFILGGYAVTMDKSVVLDGPKKSAGSHSTELFALEHSRISELNDTAEGSTLNDGQVKQITGVSDTISGREIFGKQKEFKPAFVPFINTNFEIQMNLTDKAMYARLVVVSFVLSFVMEPKDIYERQIDLDLESRLKKNKTGVLKWLVNAAVYYHANKDQPIPECIKEEKEKYNKQVNTYLNFIDTIFERKENSIVTRVEILALYKSYCGESGLKFNSRNAEREFDKMLSSGRVGKDGKLSHKKTGPKCFIGIIPRSKNEECPQSENDNEDENEDEDENNRSSDDELNK